MSKHTPGPWEFELYSSGGFEIHSPKGSRRKSLLVIASRGSHSAVKEMHANARLIAAAPQLLEALEALLLARDQDKYPSWEKGMPEFNKAEALARAAIRAAKVEA